MKMKVFLATVAVAFAVASCGNKKAASTDEAAVVAADSCCAAQTEQVCDSTKACCQSADSTKACCAGNAEEAKPCCEKK